MLAKFNLGTLTYIGATILLILSACSAQPIDPGSSEPKPAKLVTLEVASSQTKISLPAVVRSTRSTDLAFQVGGQITTWNAIRGSEFRRGEVIASLDPRSFKNAVARAEAQYQNAESEFRRAERLIAEDAISKSVLESREARLIVAQAALDDARKSLSDAVIRAPFDGFIGRTYVEQFQNVAPQVPVFNLLSSNVEVIANAPGSMVLNSGPEDLINAFVELHDAPGRRFPARYKEATRQADQSTQTFEGRFTFDPPSDLIVLSGMTANLYFEFKNANGPAKESAGIEVPFSAVMRDKKKSFVWVVKGPGRTVSRREITLAEGVGETLVATSGLKEGETIVAAGGTYLSEGDKVRAWKQN